MFRFLSSAMAQNTCLLHYQGHRTGHWQTDQLQQSRYQTINMLKLCSLVWIIKLTRWGWVMYICVSKLTTIGSDNSLSPGRHQAIIQTNAGELLIGPLGTNFSEISIEIHKNVVCKMASMLSLPQCVNNSDRVKTEICSDYLHLFMPCFYPHDRHIGKSLL